MRVPIRSGTCGCCISTKYNRYDTTPFYTYCGEPVVVRHNKCPMNKPEHENITTYQKPIYFFGKLIGHLQFKTGGTFSRYIIINEHKCRGYFFWNDVYCKECGKWHFK